MQNEPIISVVMATYNGERFIYDAIQSILGQSFKDFEFIVVNDGSTDGTENIIKNVVDERLVYIKKDYNSGIADSLNIGIANAKGSYIARMDDDDIALPIRLELQLEAFIKNDTLIVCGSNVWLKNGAKERKNPESHEQIMMQMLFENPITHPSVMIKKEVLIKHLYCSEMVPSEDYELWSRLIWEGKFYNIQKPLLHYRSNEFSETTTRRKEQLKLSVTIADYIFSRLGFNVLNNHDFYLNTFISHDYSISGKELNMLIAWLEGLKKLNKKKVVFNSQKFEIEIDKHLKKFLISYFTNRPISKKIKPFFYLSLSHKITLLNYYFNKIYK